MGKPESAVENQAAVQVWDHARTPGCADTHYPIRHNGGFVTLRVDGSVKWRRPDSMKTSEFISDIGP